MARKKTGRVSAPASPAPSTPALSPALKPAPVQIPVGISLGSQYGSVAIFKDGVAQVIANEDGDRSTPLWVTIADGQQLVGAPALQASVRHVRSAISEASLLLGLAEEELESVRRSLGIATRWSEGAWEIDVEEEEAPRRITPLEATTLYIRRLKETVESNLGMPLQEVVMSVPATYNNKQRFAIVEAANNAGLRIQRLINEPTAVALANNAHQAHDSDASMLVIDLGANSLDLTHLASFGGIMEVVSAHRDTSVGVRKLDDVVAGHFAADFKRKTRMDLSENARARTKLRHASETVKRALSSTPTAACTIESLHEGADLQSNLNRMMFETISSNYFNGVHQSITSFIESRKVGSPATILLAGGGSNIPRFQTLVSALFPSSQVVRAPSPEESAALGCALEASFLLAPAESTSNAPTAPSSAAPTDEVANVEVDALSASVGVADAAGNMVFVLRSGCPVPVKRTVSVALPPAQDGADRSVLVSVYAGESNVASENKLVCQLALRNVHAAAENIEVAMAVNAAGKLTVGAFDRADHKGATVVV